MNRTNLKRIIVLSFLGLLIIGMPVFSFAKGTQYGVCWNCGGDGKCNLCDPAENPDGLGNGIILCMGCHSTGYIACGSERNGDGEIIGCDGSGYDANGGICGICNGTGKYPCATCKGVAGIHDTCRCLQEGYTGKCVTCRGTGWLYADISGKIGQNSGDNQLYPEEGAKIFLGGGKTVIYSNAYGTHVTAQEFKESVAREGTKPPVSTDHTEKNETPENDLENPPADQPEDSPAEEPSEGISPYTVTVADSNETKKQIQDAGTDMIYLLYRNVDGEHLLSIQIVKSDLSEEEKKILSGMSEKDIEKLKEDLESMANGFSFDEIPGFTAGSYRTDFTFGTGMQLPVPCDVLIQLPEKDIPQEAALYFVSSDSVTPVGIKGVDAGKNETYLIFTTDNLNRFILTNGNVQSEKQIEEETKEEISVQEEQPVKKTGMIGIIIGIVAVIGLLAVVLAKKK